MGNRMTARLRMERLQHEPFGLVATTIAAATVFLAMLFLKLRLRRASQQRYTDVSSLEQRKQRVAAAALSRYTQRHDGSIAVRKKKMANTILTECPQTKRAELVTASLKTVDPQEEKRCVARLTAESRQRIVVGGEDEKLENDDEVMENNRLAHHGAKILSPPNENKQHGQTEAIRQASFGDQVAWSEERASRQEFGGFSIYGHAPPCAVDGCCSVVGPGRRGRGGTEGSFASPPTGFDAIQGVSEIASLPGSDQARHVLQQLCHEFEPVVRSRGWSVGKVVEMCCCNSTKPPNVAGYCVTSGDGRTARSIHIRLRPPGSCQRSLHFYPYTSLVQTMAHELAHVKILAHNDAFFKLMAELAAERLHFLANGDVSMTISSGRRLGGTASSGSQVIGSQDLKRMVATAAVKRQAGEPKQYL